MGSDAAPMGGPQSVAAVRGQIAAKELALRSMQTFATEQNPGVVLTQQELASLRQLLAKLEGGCQVPIGANATVVCGAKAAIAYWAQSKWTTNFPTRSCAAI